MDTDTSDTELESLDEADATFTLEELNAACEESGVPVIESHRKLRSSKGTLEPHVKVGYSKNPSGAVVKGSSRHSLANVQRKPMARPVSEINGNGYATYSKNLVADKSTSPGLKFVEDLLSAPHHIDDNSVDEEVSPKRKLSVRDANKLKRMRGQSYVGFSKVVDSSTKKRRSPQDAPREARKIGKACQSAKCRKCKVRFCNEFSEDLRCQLFKSFWKLNWGEKKEYVKTLVDRTVPRRCKKKQGPTRKNGTFIYYLKLNGVRKQVCKSMFLNTLAIRNQQLYNWLTESNPNSERKIPVVRKGGDTDFARRFLRSIPKLESHYCRKDTKRKYLEPVFRSVAQLYEVFCQKCSEEGVLPIIYNTFLKIVDAMKISVHQPKKDMCDICTSFNTGNLSQEEFDEHIVRKNAARDEKKADKDKARNGEIHVVTMDMQKVLLSPVITASTMYYKTKLIVHNFTVFDLTSADVTCFLWNESEAGLTAPVFATCLVSFLEQHYNDNLPIVIFSDGCTNQNRNATMSNALLHYAVKHKKMVIQKYLEKGHTQMEVDSVHAKIENKLEGVSIYKPSDYVNICKTARREHGGYAVKTMLHSDFVNYSVKMAYKSIRPGSRKVDPHVTDLRQLKYNPEGTIEYKLNHNQNWVSFPRRFRVDPETVFPNLYSSRLPIAKRKFEDLQSMLYVLPNQCHEFYKSLPHD